MCTKKLTLKRKGLKILVTGLAGSNEEEVDIVKFETDLDKRRIFNEHSFVVEICSDLDEEFVTVLIKAHNPRFAYCLESISLQDGGERVVEFDPLKKLEEFCIGKEGE